MQREMWLRIWKVVSENQGGMRSACKADFDLLVKAVMEIKRMNLRFNRVISSYDRRREDRLLKLAF